MNKQGIYVLTCFEENSMIDKMMYCRMFSAAATQ